MSYNLPASCLITSYRKRIPNLIRKIQIPAILSTNYKGFTAVGNLSPSLYGRSSIITGIRNKRLTPPCAGSGIAIVFLISLNELSSLGLGRATRKIVMAGNFFATPEYELIDLRLSSTPSRDVHGGFCIHHKADTAWDTGNPAIGCLLSGDFDRTERKLLCGLSLKRASMLLQAAPKSRVRHRHGVRIGGS